jgi:hypothetical protein
MLAPPLWQAAQFALYRVSPVEAALAELPDKIVLIESKRTTGIVKALNMNALDIGNVFFKALCQPHFNREQI